ncbi:MAG: tetratricopeptide repeat protein [Desulfuromonadales bacterium]
MPRHNNQRAQQQTQQRARQLLDAQDYTGTIYFIQDELSKGLDEQALAKEYLQAVNASLVEAELLMKQGHYQRAALLFKTVRDSDLRSLELQQQITASPTQLTDKINLCTEKLMDAGLVAYRSGDFAKAIDSWEQVLKFNPQHQAAQNSIQTTQLQLAKLKALNSKE